MWKTRVNKHQLDNSLSWRSLLSLEGEAVCYLWMMLLSYSCPSGVSMMEYSSLVTWSKAGWERPLVTWLITRGKSLLGESAERAPTAFFTACREKHGHKTFCYLVQSTQILPMNKLSIGLLVLFCMKLVYMQYKCACVLPSDLVVGIDLQ